VIERLGILALARRHPRSVALSRYLEDDLDARQRHALESHLRDCPRCRQVVDSLETTVGALRSLEAESSAGLADSIIAALRAENPPETTSGRQAPDVAGRPSLSVVPVPGSAAPGERSRRGWAQGAHAAVRWCVQPRQLRLTMPIALMAGIVLSLVNMGGMLMHGRIDLGVCVSCTIDFLVPFLALNLALMMLLWLPRRSRH
jgi:anti-sigma factor RsiW